MNIKFFKKHAANIIFLSVLIFLFIQKAPSIYEMYKAQGRRAPDIVVVRLDNQEISLPQQQKQLLVFWATWCGPCKVELARINKLIKDKRIMADAVIAVSVSEDPELVKTFARENGYQFQVALDISGKAAETYKVAGTPTLVLINENDEIEWMTMGLSPTLELRLLSMLK